jgi:sporulation protein YlmC with PRC-barrel domain
MHTLNVQQTKKEKIMTPKLLTSSSINGIKVKNKKGESIGKIEDLMIDWNKGVVSYAVLSFGGFLGIGNKFFSFPLESFDFNSSVEDVDIVLDISKESLKDAPGFDKDSLSEYSRNPEFTESVYKHYNISPYFGQQWVRV